MRRLSEIFTGSVVLAIGGASGIGPALAVDGSTGAPHV